MDKPAKDRTAPHPTATDPRWRHVLARDKTADGAFWYSVATTGIYCRPSCPSRAANPDHVTLHDSLDDARATGFRACKRCNPEGLSADASHAAIIAKACRLIEHSETSLSLADLADAVELSPSYFHRLFKSTTGVTPKAYAAAHRVARLRDGLDKAGSVTQAIYAAGFNSNGRFYEQASDILGMTPTRYKAGGRDEEICFAIAQCSLGAILVASSAKGVVSILLGDDANALAEDLQDRFPQAHLVGGDADYDRLVARVVGLVEAPKLGLDLPLDVRGTAFQQRVWQALRDIPAGRTLSYRDIAERIGAPKAVRAVAGACAANHIAIAIPCHRVVRNDGALSGYAWGVERKRELLRREDAA
ncbi:bifunctional DNA-binding transcriptional regulator/O6-methylguanine-DNA methyltransferase Ada [Sphingomonas abietis]|uniref:Bifunctional DNA-binding transcriptional regulator/O6-methylguanine-DNA methyltransferase Ada n=1 Tax=Sphingomonas abietis TaxID=3012344 RepID=A0ABY7NJC5_9SPHN|nr:bifunctional DNA-binding transcriptional regulator/O6-methylguanine-DNA methyltransferase Ada [Sphingomonas abietis]WBO21347.1 bifunctional DNA-binding transcriptional regulator/O6-methylguanine-DNA methyltransferase Ada [Sphingomonas abietis]